MNWSWNSRRYISIQISAYVIASQEIHLDAAIQSGTVHG